MISYYFRLASVSIRKNLVMSFLMVAAIGLGIGTCMTIVTVNYIMGKDPIPTKSAQLFAVQLDSWDPNRAFNDEEGRAPDQITHIDAVNLMAAGRAHRQAAMTGLGLVIQAEDPAVKPFDVTGRGTYADFFAMFEVPFIFGGPWSQDSDDAREQVAVLSREINDRVFGGVDSIGQTLTINGEVYRVVGVIDDWKPIPRFYDITTGPFDPAEGVFIPFTLIAEHELPRRGNTNCWKPPASDGFASFLASECVWIQFWAELPSRSEHEAYLGFLNSYAQDQKALGRFPRPINNHARNVNDWLERQEVVQDDATMLIPVAIMFLAVCLLNTIGLLLAKFLGKAPEIGLRRALGASKGSVFVQYLIESACIGVVGGLLGVLLTWLGLRGIKLLFGELVENLVQLDWIMVVAAVLLAVTASVAAGLYPTWRACSIEPAGQLKAQ